MMTADTRKGGEVIEFGFNIGDDSRHEESGFVEFRFRVGVVLVEKGLFPG